jgi:hypothetical protein
MHPSVSGYRGGHAGTKGHMHEVHAHGDGTFHTIAHDGTRTEHPHFGHMVAHLAKHHATDDHMHIHGHEDGFTTHHMVDGKTHGPHHHETMGALKRHVADTMDGEDY